MVLPATGRDPSSRNDEGSGICPEPESVSATSAAGATPKVARAATSAWGKTVSTAGKAAVTVALGFGAHSLNPPGPFTAAQSSGCQSTARTPSTWATSAGGRPPGGWFSGFFRSTFGSTSAMAWSGAIGSAPVSAVVFTPLPPPRTAMTYRPGAQRRLPLASAFFRRVRTPLAKPAASVSTTCTVPSTLRTAAVEGVTVARSMAGAGAGS